MGPDTRVHDGILGSLLLLATLLGYFVNPNWHWLSGLVGATMAQSAFTGFCPLYYTLGKLRTRGRGVIATDS